jgi:hypothetical protein
MKRIFCSLAFIAFLILSLSQIYLWKDQVEQWRTMETQIQMLQRLLQLRNTDKPFVYEDETPGNNLPTEQQDI